MIRVRELISKKELITHEEKSQDNYFWILKLSRIASKNVS